MIRVRVHRLFGSAAPLGPNNVYIRSTRYSTQIKPISYIKADSAAVLEKLAEEREPIIITWRQLGEATSRAGLPSPARADTAWRACRQSKPAHKRPAGATQRKVASHQNGEAKAVLQDVRSYEETQETLALLKILALGEKQVQKGKVIPAMEAIAQLRVKYAR